ALHHGGLHLEESPLVEELPDLADQQRATLKDRRHLRVCHQVEIPLPVASLHVDEAMPLLWQRAERLGQQTDLFNYHGELAGAGPKEAARDPQKIADICPFQEAVRLVTEPVLAQVYLDLAGAVLEIGEGRLAVVAQCHH